jgi:hypothetical protein
MTRKPATPSPEPRADRRSGSDRRRVDNLPPGQRDRRRSIDARKPEVIELEMSNSEWSALQPELPTPRKPEGKAA